MEARGEGRAVRAEAGRAREEKRRQAESSNDESMLVGSKRAFNVDLEEGKSLSVPTWQDLAGAGERLIQVELPWRGTDPCQGRFVHRGGRAPAPKAAQTDSQESVALVSATTDEPSRLTSSSMLTLLDGQVRSGPLLLSTVWVLAASRG
jgi:hypothetical protein